MRRAKKRKGIEVKRAKPLTLTRAIAMLIGHEELRGKQKKEIIVSEIQCSKCWCHAHRKRNCLSSRKCATCGEDRSSDTETVKRYIAEIPHHQGEEGQADSLLEESTLTT